MMNKGFLLVTVAIAAVSAEAVVRPASIFTDGAVLQAKRPVPVWGMADPGEKVVVKFAEQTKTVKAGVDGKWRVTLDPMAYSSVGRKLVVGGTTFSDVLVGEVWLGIGQSNMEYPLDLCEEGKTISKGGVLPRTIRYFHLPKDGDEKPRDMFAVPEGVRWRAYTKENEKENRRSSMLLALFAQRLAPALDVPIGVIGAAVGGANLETWMRAEAIAEAGTEEEAAKLLKMCEGWHQNDIKRWKNRPESEKNRPYPKINYESRPTQVWNAMVPPLAPYAVRGMIWYQGEMNSGWQKYEKQFPFFVKHLRAAFGVTDQPLAAGLPREPLGAHPRCPTENERNRAELRTRRRHRRPRDRASSERQDDACLAACEPRACRMLRKEDRRALAVASDGAGLWRQGTRAFCKRRRWTEDLRRRRSAHVRASCLRRQGYGVQGQDRGESQAPRGVDRSNGDACARPRPVRLVARP